MLMKLFWTVYAIIVVVILYYIVKFIRTLKALNNELDMQKLKYSELLDCNTELEKQLFDAQLENRSLTSKLQSVTLYKENTKKKGTIRKVPVVAE